MLGAYDFCGHYEWTFEWLRQRGGEQILRKYWEEAIAQDSQQHASVLIEEKGVAGMRAYWGETLKEEGGEQIIRCAGDVFRLDMHQCPSKGFLIRNDLEQYHDYCDHCVGWIGPVMKKAGYVVHHEHNHCGQCWWELRRVDDPNAATPPGSWTGGRDEADVRLSPNWKAAAQTVDHFDAATAVAQKRVRSND